MENLAKIGGHCNDKTEKLRLKGKENNREIINVGPTFIPESRARRIISTGISRMVAGFFLYVLS